jgi:hypothetical protein
MHFQKLARRTYLIPPPSAVAGLFGAILGVPRNKLKAYCKEQKILAGAELRNLEGYYITFSRIFKFDRDERGIIRLLREWLRNPINVYREIFQLMPLKESEELFKPEYKFAIAAEDKVIEEGLRRVRELDFEYDIFGGNDYYFADYIGDARESRLIKSKEGSGYCLAEAIKHIHAREYKVVTNTKCLLEKNDILLPLVIPAPVGPEMELFVFVYKASIVVKSERDAVQDEESTIFVFDPVRCLVP